MIRSDLALAALASAAVPGMKPVSVAGVHGGETSARGSRYQTAFVTDATGRVWVVRVPLDPGAGAALDQNAPLVRLLGRHLPFKVPAPVGHADVGVNGRAAVYPFVEGAALNLRELPAGNGLGNALGRAIAAVHNIPIALFEEAGVQAFDAGQVRARKLAELDRAAETGVVPTGLLARWEQALDAEPLWRFSTTCVHGRVDGDSFLVSFSDDDAATGRIVAMTGWDEAKVGDPAEDFAVLVARAAPRAVDTVVDSYALARSTRPDPHFVHRARLAAEMVLVAGLASAVAAGEDDIVQERADRLRRLDRLTASDDSLIPRTAAVVADDSWRTGDDDVAPGDTPGNTTVDDSQPYDDRSHEFTTHRDGDPSAEDGTGLADSEVDHDAPQHEDDDPRRDHDHEHADPDLDDRDFGVDHDDARLRAPVEEESDDAGAGVEVAPAGAGSDSDLDDTDLDDSDLGESDLTSSDLSDTDEDEVGSETADGGTGEHDRLGATDALADHTDAADRTEEIPTAAAASPPPSDRLEVLYDMPEDPAVQQDVTGDVPGGDDTGDTDGSDTDDDTNDDLNDIVQRSDS